MNIIKNAAGKWLIEVDDKEQIIRLYEELKAEEDCSQCTQGCSSCDNVFKLAQNDEWIKLLEPIVKDVLNENFREDAMNPHWIVKESDCISVFTWMCSSCGYSYDSLGIASPEDAGFYHCPWCGSRLIDPDKEPEK